MTHQEYVLTDYWENFAASIRRRDKLTCRFCGETKWALHVHHLRYKPNHRFNESSADCISVCGFCHTEIEFELKNKYPKNYQKIVEWVTGHPDRDSWGIGAMERKTELWLKTSF